MTTPQDIPDLTDEFAESIHVRSTNELITELLRVSDMKANVRRALIRLVEAVDLIKDPDKIPQLAAEGPEPAYDGNPETRLEYYENCKSKFELAIEDHYIEKHGNPTDLHGASDILDIQGSVREIAKYISARRRSHLPENRVILTTDPAPRV